MSLEVCALELEIEAAWLGLKSAVKPRTIYLTPHNRLHWGDKVPGTNEVEVGTYRAGVHLIDFREDVFFAAEQRGERRHG